MDSVTLVEDAGATEVRYGRIALLRYVHEPHAPAVECVKPFAHPVRTLHGDIVTAFRPADHRWHTGLFLGFSKIDDQDFWGGPTWIADRGWVQLDNVGSIRHTNWEALETNGRSARLVESLEWYAANGERWLAERRLLEVGGVDAVRGAWTLDIEFVLRNVSDRRHTFSSVATAGLPGYGYGGFSWRGPRSFEAGHFLTDREEGDRVHGSRAPWLAFVGEHDEHDRWSTIVFIDDRSNPRYPTRWFAWLQPFESPVVSCALVFDEPLVLGVGQELRLRYGVLIAVGAWQAADIQDYLDGRRP
jgi:hypothetical protein